MVNLQELSLVVTSENSMASDHQLGQSIAQLKHLISLNLIIEWGNKLGPIGAKNIGDGIKNLTNLQNLSLHIGFENNINLDGGISIG